MNKLKFEEGGTVIIIMTKKEDKCPIHMFPYEIPLLLSKQRLGDVTAPIEQSNCTVLQAYSVLCIVPDGRQRGTGIAQVATRRSLLHTCVSAS